MQFVPLQSRARVAQIFLVVTIAVDLTAIAFNAWEITILGHLIGGDNPDIEAFLASDERQSAIASVEALLLLATGLAFLVWFRSAYRNIVPLLKTELPMSSGWAIGAWFVPFLNLWRPKQMTDDIWRASEPGSPYAVGHDWRSRASSGLVTAWWTFWIITLVVSNAGVRLFFTAETLGEYRRSDILDIASLAADIVTAVLAVVLVRRITARQLERATAAESSLEVAPLAAVAAV